MKGHTVALTVRGSLQYAVLWAGVAGDELTLNLYSHPRGRQGE